MSAEQVAPNATSTTPPSIQADSASVGGTQEKEDDTWSTFTADSEVYNFHRENGRTYHGYRAGTYPFPNDNEENERLEYQYLILHDALQERLHFAPLSDPKHILDIGTGTGRWAIEMGDLYPNANVEGTDLSPIQPQTVPENVQFLIDDAESPDWAVPLDHYDFIHTRVMLGSFVEFKNIIAQGFKHTKPGGYMESHEVMLTPYSDDGTMPDDWPYKEWSTLMHDASMIADRPLRIARHVKKWYIEAGFSDVHELIFRIPIGSWAHGSDLKELGKSWAQNLLLGLRGFSLAYCSRYLNWSPEQIEVYLINVRQCLQATMKERDVHAYHKLHVVWGQKPEAGAKPKPQPQPQPQSQSQPYTESQTEGDNEITPMPSP